MNYYMIAAEGRLEKIREAAEKIVDKFRCEILSGPSSGMIMVKHLDPVEKTPFYIGEAFVTQCEVEIEGSLGYGCILGDVPERAIYAAIIDSRLGNGMDIPVEAMKILRYEMEYIEKQRIIDNERVLKTKVNFDVKKG
jgi:alpha-D-ribose 1-methylphosphonate 5-triphosphate synthase subunit PhnG